MANLFTFNLTANETSSYSFISGKFEVRIYDGVEDFAIVEAAVLNAIKDGLINIATDLEILTVIDSVNVSRTEDVDIGLQIYPAPE